MSCTLVMRWRLGYSSLIRLLCVICCSGSLFLLQFRCYLYSLILHVSFFVLLYVISICFSLFLIKFLYSFVVLFRYFIFFRYWFNHSSCLLYTVLSYSLFTIISFGKRLVNSSLFVILISYSRSLIFSLSFIARYWQFKLFVFFVTRNLLYYHLSPIYYFSLFLPIHHSSFPTHLIRDQNQQLIPNHPATQPPSQTTT